MLSGEADELSQAAAQCLSGGGGASPPCLRSAAHPGPRGSLRAAAGHSRDSDKREISGCRPLMSSFPDRPPPRDDESELQTAGRMMETCWREGGGLNWRAGKGRGEGEGSGEGA